MPATLRLLVGCSLISFCGAAAGPSTTLAHLPNTTLNAVKVDASGNIYIAGFQGTVGTPDSYDAFVTKLSPDGSKILYSTRFAGSKSDYIAALDIDSAGAAYVFGQTQSPDFPVTAGALQTTMLGSSAQGFVAKVDAQGKVVYATLIGGGSEVDPSPSGLLVDAAGEVVVSGQTIGGNFPNTPGAPFTSTDTNTYFVLKLNVSGGKLLAAIRGVGGRIATDDQGSIYVAGLDWPSTIPITPGAFQSKYTLNACAGTGQVGMGCVYQYVTKLNANLSQIVYSTYVTGSWGASPVAISVDAQGNVVLAGTTNSPDYPTTSNAFQPFYAANAPAPPNNCLFVCVVPPPASGYITKLNATGTGLIYSTFLSGTQADTIAFAAVTSAGIYLSGLARSTDFPGMEGFPSQCLPETYATRLSIDGSVITAARLVPGNVLAYDPATGMLLAWTGADLISFDPAAPPTPITCILDAADSQPVTSIAPGELLSIFGAHFVNGWEAPAPGSFATSTRRRHRYIQRNRGPVAVRLVAADQRPGAVRNRRRSTGNAGAHVPGNQRHRFANAAGCRQESRRLPDSYGLRRSRQVRLSPGRSNRASPAGFQQRWLPEHVLESSPLRLRRQNLSGGPGSHRARACHRFD